MELRHLRYFVAVAAQRNFTRAAGKLFIAQPPLTRAITQHEEEIGVQLFIRKPRGLELTSGGAYFLAHAQQILDKVESPSPIPGASPTTARPSSPSASCPRCSTASCPTWSAGCGRTRIWKSS